MGTPKHTHTSQNGHLYQTVGLIQALTSIGGWYLKSLAKNQTKTEHLTSYQTHIYE